MHKRLVRVAFAQKQLPAKGGMHPRRPLVSRRHACNPAPGAVLTKSVSVAVCRVTDARLDGSRIIVRRNHSQPGPA